MEIKPFWGVGNQQTQGGTRTYVIGGADLNFSGLSSTSQAIVNATGGGGVGGNEYPKIFVNILVFDRNYNFLDVAWEQINGGAETLGGAVNPHDYMSREYIAKQEGYVYLYVSNESPTQVDAYFDDVVITRTPTKVIQYNEYYPFGLNTEDSWTRENVTGNNFQYNESTEQNPTTGYYDLFFRNFDPTLGRFMQVDPLASRYHNQSTYQYGNNDPVYWTDASGAGSEYQRASEGGCGCWRDTDAQDASAGMYGSSFEKYGLGTPDPFTYNRDAAAVRNGSMSLDQYEAKYGSSISGDFSNFPELEEAVGALTLALGLQRDEQGQLGYWQDYGLSSQGLLGIGSRFVLLRQAQTRGDCPTCTARFFSNEGEAYKYMWQNSFDADGKVKQELAGWLLGNGSSYCRQRALIRMVILIRIPGDIQPCAHYR